MKPLASHLALGGEIETLERCDVISGGEPMARSASLATRLARIKCGITEAPTMGKVDSLP